MMNQGPQIERLTRRLSETPPDFLDDPRLGAKGLIHVDAVISDLVEDLGGETLTPAQAKPFQLTAAKSRNWLQLVLVASWLLHDEWFRTEKKFAKPAYNWLQLGLNELAGLVAAKMFVTDAERREELVRLCLAALSLLPQDETAAQAQDRLKTLGSVERAKVVQATRAAEERARKLREEMAAKQAREAAARWNHE